jgi:hypothetical protein
MTIKTWPGAGVVCRVGCEELLAGSDTVPIGFPHVQVLEVPSVKFSLNFKVPKATPGGGTTCLRAWVTLLVQKDRYPGPFMSPEQLVTQMMLAEWELSEASAGMKVGVMSPRIREMDTTAVV